MPEDDPPSEHAADHHRPFGRSKWKGNPFARKAKVVQEDDLSDFLHGPDGNTRPASRLDTDSVAPLPSSKNASQSTGSETSFAKQHASQPYVPSLNFLRKKKKGFTVRFTDAAPEIIGEGGDEAELPSMAVSRAHAYSSNTAEPRKHGSAPMGTYQTEKSEPPYSLPGGPVTKTDSGFMRMSLQRRPTGFDDVQYTEKGGAYTLGVDDNRREETTQGPGKLKLEDQQPFWTAPVPDIRLGEEKESKGDGALKTYAPIPVRPVPFLENRRERDSSPASSLLQAPTSAFGNGEPYPHNSSPWAEPFGATPLGHLPSSLLPGASTASLDDSSYRFAEEVAERDIDALLQSEEVEDYAESAVVPSGDEALHEFHTRTQHLDNAFRLAAAKGRSLMDISLSAWVRASTWFFLKGVSELESSTRKRPRSSGGPQDDGADNISPATMQAYVDLAKAWWIVKEVIPTHPQSDIFKNPVAKPPYSNPGDLRPAQLMQAHRLVAANMRALTISMKKSDLLPPGAIFIQGLDANIWVEYPTFPSDIVGILSGRSPRSLNLGNHIKIEPFFETPLSDTNRHFSYGRMFVEVSIVSDIKDIATRLPCLLSILRERTDSGVEATIVSQNGLVNIHLQGDERKSLTWDDVHWINKARIMRVNLGRLEIDVQLSEADYKTLWGIYNYTHKIAKNWYPRNNEEIVFDDVVKIFHYIDRPKPFSGFPRDQIRNCKIRVLEKKVLLSEGTGLRKIHDGHRLMVVTPPEMKALSSINQEFGKNSAITFSYLRGEDSAPALLLGTLDNGIKISMVITFNEAVRRAQLHSLLSGISVNRGESVLGEMPLEELQISTRTGDEAKLSFLPGVQWQQIRVINQSSDEYSYENPPTILSEHLRMIVNNNFGTIADRINIGKKMEFS